MTLHKVADGSKDTRNGLPVGWRWDRLGNIADNLDSKRKPVNASERELRQGDVPYYGATGQVGWIDKHLLDEEVVLVGEDGAPFLEPGRAKAYMISGKSWVNNHAHVLRAKDGMPNAYLMHFLNILDYAPYVSGTTRLKLTKGAMGRIPVPVAPLPEQRRIVSAIETQLGRLDAAVARLHAAKAKLKRYKQAVLKAAVEGELTVEWRGKQKKLYHAAVLHTQLLSDRKRTAIKSKDKAAIGPGDDLPELTEGWTWASLEELAQPNRPIIYGIIKPGPHVPDGVPYVRVTEMKDGTIDVASLKKASKERAAKFARATLTAGDVLISKDGTIGRVAVVPPELEGGNITQHVMRAPISPLVNRDYVVWAIRSEWCQRWLTGETRGVALRGVNVEDFRRLPIPLPPLAEQEQIVREAEDRMTRAEEMEATLDAQLLQSTRLRQAVLKRAFEGRLV